MKNEKCKICGIEIKFPKTKYCDNETDSNKYKFYRNKNLKQIREKEEIRSKIWKQKNKERVRKTNKIWKQKNKEKNKILIDKINFGGNTQKVLERDNFCCQKCGITQEQHLIIFGRKLSIHHIDGNGSNKIIKNNNISNLICLCSVCHAKINDKGKLNNNFQKAELQNCR